jgi:imidazolonepropionase-like amidohydrolase
VQTLEKIFQEARVYKGVPANSKLKPMKGLFDGSKTLYISTGYVKTIIESIKFAQRMGVKRIVLAKADEDALLIKDFLRENRISVILNHIHRLPKRKDSFTRGPFALAADFKRAGISAAITYYGATGSMNLPFAGGQCVPYGLTKEEVLQAMTLIPAKILGIDNRAGSLKVNKDAHIIVSKGDLLDIKTNKVTYAYINGRAVNLDNKHKRLYRKFSTKYGQKIIE